MSQEDIQYFLLERGESPKDKNYDMLKGFSVKNRVKKNFFSYSMPQFDERMWFLNSKQLCGTGSINSFAGRIRFLDLDQEPEMESDTFKISTSILPSEILLKPWLCKRSRSVSQRYGSGSGSFQHQAKIVRYLLFVCDFFMTFYLWGIMYVRTGTFKK